MKLGLDIHGVIDTNPEFFSEFSRIAIDLGIEIHILTGSQITKEKIEDLKMLGMCWSNLFSISDYHKSINTPMSFTDEDNPWIEISLWDKTKAEYCSKNNIVFHIDDTIRYGEHFKNHFGYYDHINKRIDWHSGTLSYGVLPVSDPYDLLSRISRIVSSNSYT